MGTAFTAGLLGLVLALVAKPEDFGLANTLTLATVMATGAFGADLQMDATASGIFEGSADASVGLYPFTITLSALTVAVLLFRRMTRGYAHVVDALTDAARTALIFGVCLWLPALVFTSDNDELGRGWGADLDAASLGIEAEVGANPGGALLLGFLILLAVLLVSCLMRADWWDNQEKATPGHAALRRLVGWLQAPLAGVTAVVALLPIAGAIGLIAVLLFGENNDLDTTGDETRLTIALCAALLANGGLWVLAIGSGSRFGSITQAEGGGTEEEWERLWGQITADEPGLWVSPAVLVAVLVLAAILVVRRSSSVTAFRSLIVWVGLLVVAVPLLVRLTSVHAAGSTEAEGEAVDGSVYLGPDGVQTTLLIVVAATVVAFVVALVRGVLEPSAVSQNLKKAARTIQRPDSPPAESGPEEAVHLRGPKRSQWDIPRAE